MTPEWFPRLYMILALGIVPFAAYFLGVYIGNTVFSYSESSNDNRPKLKHQFLLAIPFSIAIVGPLITVLTHAISDSNDWPAYLITIGIIIENGMFINEAVAVKIAEYRSRSKERISQIQGK